jgi:hypothetical protein
MSGREGSVSPVIGVSPVTGVSALTGVLTGEQNEDKKGCAIALKAVCHRYKRSI